MNVDSPVTLLRSSQNLSMSLSELQALGPPRVVDPDGEVILSGGIPTVLLVHLCLTGIPVPRDHLAELLWPGVERETSLRNLRQALFRIRSVLQPDPIEGAGNLTIRPATLRNDVDSFHDLLSDGRTRDALALWRGSFLQGFRRSKSWELEEWIERHRTGLEQTLVSSVMRESRRVLESGDPDSALSLVERTLKFLPNDEGLLVQRVRTLAGVGRIPEARGLLKTIDLPARSELEQEISDLPDPPVQRIRPTQPDPTGQTDRSSPTEEPPTPTGSVHFKTLVRVLIVLFLVLIPAMEYLKRDVLDETIRINDEMGFSLLVCSTWATDGEIPQIYRMDFDGRNKQRISETPTCEVVWVEENGVLIASMSDEDGVLRLFRLRPKTDLPLADWEVSVVESSRDLIRPKFSRVTPKVSVGGVLVFSAEDETGNRDIYSLNTGSDSLYRLTYREEVDEWPSIDLGDDYVVFTSDRSGGGDLYSIGLDGSGLTRLTDHPLRDGAPWIRGDSILFVRGSGTGDEDGNMELMILDQTTGRESQLTDNGWNDYEQSWSPDGRFICWQSERLGHYESDIMVMDLSDGDVWTATDYPGRESDCRWTPLGNGLVFIRWGIGDGSDLFLKDPGGTDLMNLSRYPGFEAPLESFQLPAGPLR